MAQEPARNAAEVQGIRRPSPPIRSRSRVPTAWTTDPAARKSSPLKRL